MKFVWILICFVALLVPVVVLAGGSPVGFDAVVHTLETRYHAHATRIPFLGLVSLVSSAATRQGVGDLHVAEFDDFTASVDGDELNHIVEQKLGPGWERIIRETSRHNAPEGASAPERGDQTLIFMHPEGSRVGLFVLDLDGREMDVVQVSVNPDHLNQSINQYSHHQEDHDNGHDVSD